MKDMTSRTLCHPVRRHLIAIRSFIFIAISEFQLTARSVCEKATRREWRVLRKIYP